MIGLDICGAMCAGLFLYAYHVESIRLLYLATIVQQCIAGLYAPSHSAIVPQLVNSDAQLKIATTLEGLTWSATQAFGAAASGLIVDVRGIKICFIIDGASYAISALLLCLLRGSFRVSQELQEKEIMTEEVTNRSCSLPIRRFYAMVMDAARYLQSSYFGALIFLKGTAAFGFGACDILNVAFSEDASNTALFIGSNEKMGILFSLVGVGCWLGPMVADPWVHVEQPKTLQVSCLVGFGLSLIGYFGWATIPNFWSVCIFAVIRAAGSSNIWIHSTLLLQKFTMPQMMGRVLAADYAIALVCEAAAAYTCGVFMDHHTSWTPYDVSLVLAILMTCTTTGWILYHLAGRGACRYDDAKVTIDMEEDMPAGEASALLANR
jgi:MFS family permease